jgi:hypothetical protein
MTTIQISASMLQARWLGIEIGAAAPSETVAC